MAETETRTPPSLSNSEIVAEFLPSLKVNSRPSLIPVVTAGSTSDKGEGSIISSSIVDVVDDDVSSIVAISVSIVIL